MAMQLQLQNVYFDLISDGQKTVEGRVWKPKYESLRRGDVLEFISVEGRRLQRTIQGVHRYQRFEQMLQDFGIKAFLGGTVQSLDEAVAVYMSLPGYAEAEAISGVVAFSLSER